MEEPKDYCTAWFEDLRGHEIGQSCCKKHDNAVGAKGTYNPITPHIDFFNCLRNQGVNIWLSSLTAIGGTIFSWIKYPYFAYRIYKYRKDGML